MKKTIFILTPILIAVIASLGVWLSEHQGANLLFRLRIELIPLLIGTLIAAFIGLHYLKRYRFNKALVKGQNKYKTELQSEHKRFIQRLDHELKNPLTSIQLGLTNLKSMAHNAEIHQKIEDISAQTNRLTKLANDLRKLVTFDNHTLVLELTNVADLLNDTVSLCEETALTNDRKIQVSLPAAPWPVPDIMVDRDLFQLALYNLLENALKYSNAGDHIDIRAREQEGFVTIEIADTGLGISSRDLKHVTEDLFRGKNTLDRSGTGIGLPLVKRIIAKHSGSLSIDSKDGLGTRSIITLPLNAAI